MWEAETEHLDMQYSISLLDNNTLEGPETAQQLGAHAALTRTQIGSQKPTWGSLQPPEIPAPEEPIPSWAPFPWTLHLHTHNHRHKHM